MRRTVWQCTAREIRNNNIGKEKIPNPVSGEYLYTFVYDSIICFRQTVLYTCTHAFSKTTSHFLCVTIIESHVVNYPSQVNLCESTYTWCLTHMPWLLTLLLLRWLNVCWVWLRNCVERKSSCAEGNSSSEFGGACELERNFPKTNHDTTPLWRNKIKEICSSLAFIGNQLHVTDLLAYILVYLIFVRTRSPRQSASTHNSQSQKVWILKILTPPIAKTQRNKKREYELIITFPFEQSKQNGTQTEHDGDRLVCVCLYAACKRDHWRTIELCAFQREKYKFASARPLKHIYNGS